ncbi:putative proline-rich receptor-like protein kinase PERK3 [Iris pallida]|uniref:Proline-rich receptor-like protein kinase PERK3 n=1 Tax=Iris pallida TaxID=29817 RepID=A0AAX6GL60_IRIPA|nr:putative proline-rich receptor-like protein kinase PERK3 [Iris pallida]
MGSRRPCRAPAPPQIRLPRPSPRRCRRVERSARRASHLLLRRTVQAPLEVEQPPSRLLVPANLVICSYERSFCIRRLLHVLTDCGSLSGIVLLVSPAKDIRQV